MKKIQTLLLLLFISCSSFCQELSGIWEGEFSTDLVPPKRRTFFMHIEIQQTGSDVRAIFLIRSSMILFTPALCTAFLAGTAKRKSGCFL
jgi:hypothetical protein